MSKLVFLCGLVASGKSTWAEKNKDRLNAIIHSSDAIRAELGNINDQSKNDEVFNILHRRIKDDLKNGKNVVYDATNLSRKRRINFLSNELRDIPCEKICVLFATPLDICKKNNANRERKVPEDVIEKMVRNFEVPCYQEGWDDIQIVWYDWNSEGLKFDFFSDLERWRLISQNNPHHTLSIGDHMIAAAMHYDEVCDENGWDRYDTLLYTSILMHDCGKLYTKSFIDKNGNISEKARYFEHHNVGSYFSLFYLKDIIKKDYLKFTDNEVLYISLLIGMHMRPFMAYKDSEKARERDRKLFGDDFMKKLDVLHVCDKISH